MITAQYIKELWERQFGPWKFLEGSCIPIMYHPYTCGNRNDGNHEDFGGDLGILVPTIKGWICPCCDYTQPFCIEEKVDDNKEE